MIVGDMVASVGSIIIDPSEGDMAAYLDSLRRIRDRKPRILLPAHGFAIADPQAIIEQYLAHRLMRESRVLAALSVEPQSLETLVIKVYHDTPSVLHGLAQRSLLSHLMKLAEEARASQSASGWLLGSQAGVKPV